MLPIYFIMQFMWLNFVESSYLFEAGYLMREYISFKNCDIFCYLLRMCPVLSANLVFHCLAPAQDERVSNPPHPQLDITSSESA